jgi:hypothetical protein
MFAYVSLRCALTCNFPINPGMPGMSADARKCRMKWRERKLSPDIQCCNKSIRTVPALLTSFFLPSLCYLSPNSLCILQDSSSRPSLHCSSISGLPILDSSCKYLSFYDVPYSWSRFLSEKPLCKNTAVESSVCDDCQETFPVVFCISKRRLC